MNAEEYAKLKEVFRGAVHLAGDERDAYLDEACGGDDDLRARAVELLRDNESGESFLDTPALGIDFSVPEPEVVDEVELPRVAPTAGQRIGSFRVLSRLGTGGAGIVYLAQQDSPSRRVALKILLPSLTDAKALRRFEYEAELLSRLRHPGIAQVYESGTWDDGAGPRPFFAMELVEGNALLEHAAALDVRGRLELLARVCDAVQHAHGKGIVHRDLKPGNVLVDADGQPRVLDFGVARALDVDLELSLLPSGSRRVVGTLPYIAPEQIEGDPADVDARADVHALGAVAFELLAGRPPHDVSGRSITEVARMVRETDPPPLGSLDRRLRGDVEVIVQRAMEKDPSRRYASASDLAADVRRHLRHEPIEARPVGALGSALRFARRHRSLVGGVAASALALLLGLAGIGWGLLRALEAGAAETVQRERAETLLEEAQVARDDARIEAEKAVEVRDLVVDLLDRSNPFRMGRDVTLAEVLEDAGTQLDSLQGDPEAEAVLRHSFGRTLHSLGHYAAAEEHLRAAAELRAELFGPEAELTLVSRNDIGATLIDQGKSEEAREHLRELVEVDTRVLGRLHERTLTAMHNLATALIGTGEFAEAEEVAREQLLRVEAVWGPEDARTLEPNHQIARALAAQGFLPEAETYYRDVLVRAEDVLSESHPFLTQVRVNLGGLLIKLAVYDEARELLEKGLAAREALLGSEHPDTIAVLNDLAACLAKEDRVDDAIELAERALELRQRALGERHRRTGVSHNNLAKLLERVGERARAEVHFVEALDIARSTLAEGHYELSIYQGNYGRFLLAEDRFEEAEALLVPASETVERLLGPHHYGTKEAKGLVEELYRRWKGTEP